MYTIDDESMCYVNNTLVFSYKSGYRQDFEMWWEENLKPPLHTSQLYCCGFTLQPTC